MAEKDNIPEMRPTFDAIRRTDENNKEYWSSRDLCNAMGYSTNWKFQNVINKAIAVANQKGMKIDDHFNQTVDMVKLGSGAYRKVNIFRLSRMACMIIAENADGKKPLVQQAREYFSQSVSTTELIQNSLESNILLYKTAQGETRIEVIFNNETFWMSQKRMAGLFGVDRATIAYHLSQIYESGELTKEATCRKIQQVQLEGERDVERTPLFYNLDAIIAVGYRVNSYQATQFRIWATSVLKEFIIKGYVLDAEQPHMGLTTWKKAPNGRVQKSDTIVAKNYLSDAELNQLNGITTSFLDLAETRAQRHIITTMEDWRKRLAQFLAAMDYEENPSAGTVSQDEARAKAYGEYEKYKLIQDRSYISDFDRFNNCDDDMPLLPFDLNPKEI